MRIGQPFRLLSTSCIKRGIGRRTSRCCRLTTKAQRISRTRSTTRHSQGAATGAAAGAVVGSALAWSVSTQAIAITVLAPLVAAGPVLAALAGAGAGGALGWIAGLVAGVGLTEYVAKRYAGRNRSGGILLSVHCDSPEWCDRAKRTLKDTGARNISSGAEAAADYGTTDKPTERAPAVMVHRGEVPAQQTVEYTGDDTRK